MQVAYTVHNPHTAPNAVRAMFKGEEITASVDTFEVELVADDRSQGTIKLRFVGDEVAGAQALFPNEARITATFTAGVESPPAA